MYGETTQIATWQNVSATYNVTYSYTYDDNGNITAISDGTNTTSYVYDSANQLIRENNQAGGFTKTWTYDAAGNILSRGEYAYTTGELGIPTDTVTYTYGDADWGDKLTAYDGNTITYDGVGKLHPLPQIQSNSIKAAPEYSGAVLLSFRVCRCSISLPLFINFTKPCGI